MSKEQQTVNIPPFSMISENGEEWTASWDGDGNIIYRGPDGNTDAPSDVQTAAREYGKKFRKEPNKNEEKPAESEITDMQIAPDGTIETQHQDGSISINRSSDSLNNEQRSFLHKSGAKPSKSEYQSPIQTIMNEIGASRLSFYPKNQSLSAHDINNKEIPIPEEYNALIKSYFHNIEKRHNLNELRKLYPNKLAEGSAIDTVTHAFDNLRNREKNLRENYEALHNKTPQQRIQAIRDNKTCLHKNILPTLGTIDIKVDKPMKRAPNFWGSFLIRYSYL